MQFPARGSTQLLLCLFPGVLWLWHFLYSVGPHPVSSLYIYTLSLCRGHSWRVRLAKQETLTPSGHLVSPLVCRGPWMSTVVLYCWCHSDSASVLLYFTLYFVDTLLTKQFIFIGKFNTIYSFQWENENKEMRPKKMEFFFTFRRDVYRGTRVYIIPITFRYFHEAVR